MSKKLFSRIFHQTLVLWIGIVMTGQGGAQAFAASDDLVHIGHSTKVVSDVQGQIPGQTIAPIAQSEKIFFNENIITTDEASIIIQFRDGSTFELGPNGAMTIDDMVFNPFESQSDKVINLIQGGFRYVSGFKTVESNVTISTPVGVIGIRGSNDSGFFFPDGTGGGTLFNTISSGTATVANNAGTETFEAGQSTALANADADIMSADEMPVSLAAEGMSFVQDTLGVSGQAIAQNLSPGQQAADAAANTLPIDQQTLQQLPTGQGIDPAALPPTEAPALFQQAAATGALTADAINNPSPEQQAALSAVEANNPDAGAAVESFTQAGEQANDANVNTGTQDVVTGTSANVVEIAQIASLVQATIVANPDITSIAAGAAITGGNQNAALGGLDQVAQQVGQGAVAGASQGGFDVAGIIQSAGEGVITGAVSAGLDVGVVTEGATQGVVSGAVITGVDVGATTNAATQGLITGAAVAGADLSLVAKSVTAGAITASVEAGIDVAGVMKSVASGAITAAVQSGSDVAGISQSVTSAAIESSEALNLDMATMTTAIIEGATLSAEEMGIDSAAIIGPITDTVTETLGGESTEGDSSSSTDDSDEKPPSELKENPSPS